MSFVLYNVNYCKNCVAYKFFWCYTMKTKPKRIVLKLNKVII